MKTKPTKEDVEHYNLQRKNQSRNLRGTILINYKKELILTPEQKDVLVGTLLGDASFRYKRPEVNLKFEQKYTQIDYMNHLYDLFKPFVGTGPRLRIINNHFHQNYGVSCWFATYSHSIFTHYERQFYSNEVNKQRRKKVPKNIHRWLTPRALAYWFMDDGTFNINSSSYVLNTQGFLLHEQKILVHALKRNFDLEARIWKDRRFYRLAFPSQQKQCFEQWVVPYILPSFRYKLRDAKS